MVFDRRKETARKKGHKEQGRGSGWGAVAVVGGGASPWEGSQSWAVAPNPYLRGAQSPASPPSWDQPCLAFPVSLPFILHQAPEEHPGGRVVGPTFTLLLGDRGLT